jgi:hypothetical protein
MGPPRTTIERRRGRVRPRPIRRAGGINQETTVADGQGRRSGQRQMAIGRTARRWGDRGDRNRRDRIGAHRGRHLISGRRHRGLHRILAMQFAQVRFRTRSGHFVAPDHRGHRGDLGGSCIPGTRVRHQRKLGEEEPQHRKECESAAGWACHHMTPAANTRGGPAENARWGHRSGRRLFVRAMAGDMGPSRQSLTAVGTVMLH